MGSECRSTRDAVTLRSDRPVRITRGKPGNRNAEGKNNTPCRRTKRNKHGESIRLVLLGEAVGLGDCAKGYGVIDINTSGIEGFAIQFQERQIFYFGFENLHRGLGR